ncbi:hypothetical protein OJ998_27950 [Solirubrobacter taibaiensis]|nr:hypothetical protein [Solirubrobacter taibaiensis]
MARRSLSRLAWYFGIAWGDPGYSEMSPAEPPGLWRVVVGWVVAATVFAFLSEAVDGFDGGVFGSAAKGAAFATVLVAFNLLMARSDNRTRAGEKRVSPDA